VVSRRATRYERILADGSSPDGLAVAMATASAAARAAVEVGSEHERCIRDVAAGVAAPTLVGYVAWVAGEVEKTGYRHVHFLSRDGQVLCLIAERLRAALGLRADLRYLYCSRRTWNLAASDPDDLAGEAWLFGSFMRSNAADLCARLGLDLAEHRSVLERCGVSLDPEVRSGDRRQRAAMGRFLADPGLKGELRDRIDSLRALVVDYALQETLDDERSVLVDAGWTGRMVGALGRVMRGSELAVPPGLFWGYMPKDKLGHAARVSAYMFDTTTKGGTRWRLPDIPYLIESFAMADHGIVSGYRRSASGRVEPILADPRNPVAERWGLRVYRETLIAFCDALTECRGGWEEDLKPVVYRLLRGFWLEPHAVEARAWGSYAYDSDPTGTAARALARRFSAAETKRSVGTGRLARGDRAWLAGSLALTPRPLREQLNRVS